MARARVTNTLGAILQSNPTSRIDVSNLATRRCSAEPGSGREPLSWSPSGRRDAVAPTPHFDTRRRSNEHEDERGGGNFDGWADQIVPGSLAEPLDDRGLSVPNLKRDAETLWFCDLPASRNQTARDRPLANVIDEADAP